MSHPPAIHIRDFTAHDLPAALQLYQVSFPNELLAEGYTPTELAKQANALVAGNMLPFKILMWLMRRRWALLVAESAGQVVGLGGLRGSAEVVEFGPLMVLPAYRRQGVGAALTQARLARAQQMGIQGVHVGALTTNQASLGNLSRHGFTIYRHQTGYEIHLPWAATGAGQDEQTTIRPAVGSDKPLLADFEARAFGAERLAREGSRVRFFCPSWAQRMYHRWLSKDSTRMLVAEQTGRIVATAEVFANPHTPKGYVRLEGLGVTTAENAARSLLSEAARWLHQQGKQALCVYVPGQVQPPTFAASENQYCWAYLFRRL